MINLDVRAKQYDPNTEKVPIKRKLDCCVISAVWEGYTDYAAGSSQSPFFSLDPAPPMNETPYSQCRLVPNPSATHARKTNVRLSSLTLQASSLLLDRNSSRKPRNSRADSLAFQRANAINQTRVGFEHQSSHQKATAKPSRMM